MVVSGDIEAGDQLKFQNEVTRVLRSGYIISGIHFLSHGGDVDAAMNIGHQIRLLEVITYAPSFENGLNSCRVSGDRLHAHFVTWNTETSKGDSQCTCQSACSLMWAAGVSRRGDVVGIHRAHFNKRWFGSLPTDKATKVYAKSFDLFARYLREYEIPESIIRQLFATSSRSMKFLSKDQIRELKSLPSYAAANAAKEELVRTKCHRLPKSEETEDDKIKFFDCVHDVYHGPAARAHDAQIAARYLRRYAAFNGGRSR